MGRPKKKDEVQQLKPMDFAKAVSLYRNDIKPAVSQSATELKDAADGYKAIKKICYIQPQSAKAAFKAFEMEDAKRDDYLRGFVGVFNEMMGEEVLSLRSADMVDVAEGKADKAQPRGKPNLVAVKTAPQPHSDGTETDLADAANAVTGEAPAPAPGTSAAAIAAMRADHAKDKAEEDGFTEASEEELAKQAGRGEQPED